MRRSLARAGALAASLLATGLVGCAMHEDVKQDEAALGRLTINQKQELFVAQHNVEVAKANQASAQRALEQAKKYRDVADREVHIALGRLKTASDSVALARESRMNDEARAAERQERLADREAMAARGKLAFAERVVALRRSESELADRQLDGARAELALERVNTLRRNGIATQESSASLVKDRDDAIRAIVAVERRIATERDSASAARTAWLERLRAFNVAARETPGATFTRLPPGPMLRREHPLDVDRGQVAPQPTNPRGTM